MTQQYIRRLLHMALCVNRLYIEQLIEQYKGLFCDHEQIKLNLVSERSSFLLLC